MFVAEIAKMNLVQLFPLLLSGTCCFDALIHRFQELWRQYSLPVRLFQSMANQAKDESGL